MPFDNLGELLTRWTIRLALALYVVVLAGRICGFGARWRKWDRGLWTAACGLFLVHVVCAFQFYHDWSNAKAVISTAGKTKEQIGWAFGGGIYFNYFFTLLWTFDVVWSWLRPTGYTNRPLAVAAAVHVYMFFIALNSAIVFAAGPTRIFGVLASIGLLLLLIRSLYAKKKSIRPHSALVRH